jgi:hypothetical protein
LKTINRYAVLAVLTLSAASAHASPWTFTKISTLPPTIAAPAQSIESLVFEMTSGAAIPASVTQMSFLMTGNLPIGSVTKLELVYYPGGLGAPGVVVGTNDGATWGHRGLQAVVQIPLVTPLAVQPSVVQTFALRANVSGGARYFFNTDLRIVTVNTPGIDSRLLGETEDLPLSGNNFDVN